MAIEMSDRRHLAEFRAATLADRASLDRDRDMRLFEWLLVALCALAVGLLSLVH